MKKIKFTIAIAACLLVFNNANSQHNQAGSPLTVRHVSTGASWYGLQDVKLIGGYAASCTMNIREVSQGIKATNFDFHIPNNAIITGIKVSVVKGAGHTGNVKDKSVRLLINDNPVGVTKKNIGGWTSTSSYYVNSYYGDDTDLWATTFSPADINDDGFGVVFKCWNSSYSNSWPAEVDHIGVTVYYTIGLKQFQEVSSGKINSEPLSVSPNPATDKINFTIDEKESYNADVKVYNIGGGLVINENKVSVGTNESHSTDISNLNPGTYFLRIESPGDKIYTKKFIKK